MQAPEATHAPYDTDKTRLPSSLSKTLEILNSELALCADIGTDLMCYFSRAKASEIARYELAEDKDEWQQRKYVSGI
jgi:glutamine synthetase